ncbi:Phage-related protein [Bryocella elongata]|uniref:Phage-related protein n=1 Tax=Bryocella elongata TaxID=863522 RepID=A0A1H5ZPM2_9BACT|nr:type II toxin-antitoxin system RelE/ParE family toxin [Bryocella elongata]SEG37617.1 Phage-related protein [Bryocella elongata]
MAHAELERVPVVFFRNDAGGEPVRDWLKALVPVEDRKQIGDDIRTLQFGWPIGMPLCRPLGQGLFEVRSTLASHRIARVLFYFDRHSRIVLLHAFIKKSQKTPPGELAIARRNQKLHASSLAPKEPR